MITLNRFSFIGTNGHVVNSTFILDSNRSSHEGNLNQVNVFVKNEHKSQVTLESPPSGY